MSFSAQPRGLQRYSSETATQKQGKLIKQFVIDVNRLIKSIQSKSYTKADFLLLDNKLHELKTLIKDLESINPSSKHENFEKCEFIQTFQKEMEKIKNAIQNFKQPESFNQPPVEVPKAREEAYKEEQITVEIYEDELVEKARILKEVQGSIYELNGMFKDLAETVEKQGEGLDRMEDFVEISAASTNSANQEIEKAKEYQKGQRCLGLIIIPGVLALLLILIYFFAG